jgi:hypothetical protein
MDVKIRIRRFSNQHILKSEKFYLIPLHIWNFYLGTKNIYDDTIKWENEWLPYHLRSIEAQNNVSNYADNMLIYWLQHPEILF